MSALNKSQKLRRYEMCSAFLLRNNNDPFFDCIVTCDEKWILYNNRQHSAVIEPRRSSTTLPKAEAAPKKDYGDGLVVVSRSDPLFPESRWNHHGREVLLRNRRNAPQIATPALQCRHWSIEKVPFFFTTMPSYNRRCRN